MSPITKSGSEICEFIADGYKISKNKNIWGDSFFASKLGLGVADGVGGWTTYGIDPSSFSENLMHECNEIVKQRENKFYKLVINSSLNWENEEYDNDSDEPSFSTPKLDAMFKSFGSPLKINPIKRARSSFHFDEDSLKPWDQKRYNPDLENSPHSDSTSNDFETMIKSIKIEPRWIMKEAFK